MRGNVYCIQFIEPDIIQVLELYLSSDEFSAWAQFSENREYQIESMECM